MHRKIWTLTLTVLGALLLTGGVLAAARPETAAFTAPQAPQAPTDLTPTHWLTVTTTSDDGGMNERCENTNPCTLRRAINEIRYHGVDATKRVYHVGFDLSIADPGYDAGAEVWIFNVDSDNSSDTFAYRDFGTYGHAIIDGTTQPTGRDLALGPRIILRGDNRKGAFVLTGGYNVVRGLAFQGFGDNVVNIPATNHNLIENNWFGLNTAGDDIYLRDPLVPESGSGEGGIYAQMSGSNGTTNTIQSNVLVGFRTNAINVQGDQNFILSNTVGTRADGTVPDVRLDRKCKPNARYNNWFPGGGIDVFGHANEVAYNRVVGMLFQSNDPLNTPDDAISVTGWDHLVHDNVIGVASDGTPFGVCGVGIHVGGVSGGHSIQVVNNTIVGAQGAAGIYVTGGQFGYDLNAVTVQGNVILDSKVEAFDFGPILPATLRNFKPGAITQIDGLNVSGTSGAGSLCENCIVEVFLDTHDTVTETIQSLGKVTADGSGNWTFTLARTLALTEGLRTASTTAADGQILHPSGVYSAGTTTRISEIYTQTGAPAPVEPPAPTPVAPLPVTWPTYGPEPTAPGAPTLIITVTTTADPDDSESFVCYNAGYPGVVGKTNRLPCTLRQAIEEAGSVIAANPAVRPVEIRFNIPTADPGYDAGLDVWVIQLTDTLNINALPALGTTDVEKAGQVTLDGGTQPGGRADGPKIVVRGPQNRNLMGLVLNGNNNVVRRIAFQNLRMALQLNHSQNIVASNWFGLSNDGTDIYRLNDNSPAEGSGEAGVVVAANTTGTLILNNVLAGFTGAAINMEGDDGFITDNAVGTRSDETVPEVVWNRWCRPNARYYNWFGGAGIEVGGARNQVSGNRIAGLLWYSDDPLNTPDDALSVTGSDHLIQGNTIGEDALGHAVGSCGRGLVVDAGFTRVLNNTVIRTALEPFRMNGTQTSINALYYEDNLSWDSTAPNYMEFGNLVPSARKLFTPSVVLTISVAGGSTTVYGAAHPDAPCPFCQVELFLDDLDPLTETFESLAVVQSDINGDWNTTLPFELGMDEGLRTASTAFNYGIIAHFDGPSTARVSTEVYSRTGATPPPPPAGPGFGVPPAIPVPVYLAPPTPPASFVTVYTVINTQDNAASPPVGSLRWAIAQVESLDDAQRPALISFNIPTADPGYDIGGYWVITLTGSALPPVKGGQVTIDGSSQPGGRGNGPKIIIRRDSTTGDKLALGETQYEGECSVKGLALQGVELHMTGSDNIITGNWLGLNDAGDAIRLYNDDPSKQNHAIIVAGSTSNHNYIAHNILAGSSSNAINVQGDDNTIEHNTVGLLADGTIPEGAVAPADICNHTQLSGNWYGGGGIVIGGYRQTVQDNVLAGLMLYGSAQQAQPAAIQILNGRDHLIQNNRIGVDAGGAQRWTCGSGIENGGADFTRILSNTFVSGATQGILVNGNIIAINATTMQGNVISNTAAAIEFGPGTPVTLTEFAPALVTRIQGLAVTGMSDDPCPYCAVDVFRDDDDPLTEALVYLGTTYAGANGNWSFTLPAELAEGEGLRTLSTTRDYGVLPHFEVGTSSGLSMLFTPQPLTAPTGVSLTPPTVSAYQIGQAYTFIADVVPATATLPLTYTWQATGQTQRIVAAGPSNDQAFTWSSSGAKTITVSVTNDLGAPVSAVYSLTVGEAAGKQVYLPLVLRN